MEKCAKNRAVYSCVASMPVNGNQICVCICIFAYLHICACGNVFIYTVRSKSFRNDFFKNRRHIRKKHAFLYIQNKLHWHIYRVLRGPTVFEKLPKIPVFGPSLIHQLLLLGS